MTDRLLTVIDFGSAPTGRAATMALLDGYLSHLPKLVAGRPDPQLLAKLHGELQAIRHSSGLRPELWLAWLHLLIAHAELAHGVWTDECAPGVISSLERQRQLQRVVEAAGELRQGLLRQHDALP